jgi:hypothetical protein
MYGISNGGASLRHVYYKSDFITQRDVSAAVNSPPSVFVAELKGMLLRYNEYVVKELVK